ncbi:hypothetical protein FISHEDRAFT_78765 [Fistulina hepatica ATCC 64428]|uniref:Uncharacterized protein n=1 Tax=Fistulina hepatica ATCC 64428 TaxID=1128425 RepID=A0A0D7A183_9AGAR|nr:hypothetical protein FISHEDRAFT_78765 [Fistulina hepatica ATCC 64428]
MKSIGDGMGYNQGHSISGRQAPFATICVEVLDRILTNFEYPKHLFDYTTYDVYLPFTLVNHHWYAVANRHLYLYVASGMVRSIKFGMPYFDREETENHAAIIWLCRNLVALDLCGWNGFTRAPLVEAVRSAHTLKSICINHLGISDADSEGDAFCSGLELLRMMRVWPGIEEVVIHVSALSAEFYNDSTEVPESDSNRESDDKPGSTHAEWKEERRVLAGWSDIRPV